MNLDVKPADYDIEALAPGEAVAVDWTATRYHADRRTISRSELMACKDDPEGFRDARLHGRPERRKSDALELGTLVHTRLLEPEYWKKNLAPPRTPWPGWVGTAAAWARHRKITVENNPGCIDATDSKLAKVEAIVARLRSHRFAASILDLDGPTEFTIIWREPTTDILCRVRLDKLGFVSPGALVAPDLKTGRDVRPDEFSRAMLTRRYHVQAAMYSDALQALYPGRDLIYAIIAVRTSAPHKVGAWPMAQRAIDLGRDVYRSALADYKQRLSSNDWLESWETDYEHEIDLPGWAYKADR